MQSTRTTLAICSICLLISAGTASAQHARNAEQEQMFAFKFPPPSLFSQNHTAETHAVGADDSTTEPKPAATDHKAGSAEDINNKLNNPGADLSFLNFKFVWNQYQGDLGGGSNLRSIRPRSLLRPVGLVRDLFKLGRGTYGEGASSQNSVAMLFQPVFPFKLAGEGNNFIIRPTIPVVWAPHYNPRSHGYDEDFGLSDAQLVALLAHTGEGYFYGLGPTMQLPTHTDPSLGRDDFRLGPAGYAGLTGKWGAAGAFVQHWWNIGGSDGYFSTTDMQYFYWFSIGGGWQIGGNPIVSYNWAADDSDDAWTVPVGLGLQKTFRVGKLPVRIQFVAQYYVVTPDSFGPHWGLQLTLTPVIPNPFQKTVASK